MKFTDRPLLTLRSDIELCNKIIESFRDNPRDVLTIPLNNSKSRWFYVYIDNNNVIYFENARNRYP